MQPDDKDAALLPHRIDGCWALIHRPVAATSADIWISYSSDLRNWGANKIGLSPPPIETSQGWRVIYHGVKQNASGAIYRLGLALFDLHELE